MIGAIEAEQAVIGSICIDPRCISVAIESLGPEDFLSSRNSAVFAAMVELNKRGDPADLVLVLEVMKKHGDFQDGDSKMIMACMDIVGTAANIAKYVEIVAEESRKRRLQEVIEYAQQSIANHDNCFDIESHVIKTLMDSSAKERSKGVMSMSDALSEFYETRNKIDSGEIRTIRTMYSGLDSVLGGGLVNGGFYLVAARPGIGKTTFAMNMARNMARTGVKVFYVPLEMSVFDMVSKIVSTETGISASELMMRKFHDKDVYDRYDKIANATRTLQGIPLSIYDPRSGIPNMAKLAAFARVEGFEVIIIDYLGLMKKEEGKSLYEKVSATSGAIKQTALQLNIPIICLAQLNREVEGRASSAPKISDLRDSGSLEQDADTIMLLEQPRDDRDENPLPHGEPEELIVHVGKNRRGKRMAIRYDFYEENGVIRERR